MKNEEEINELKRKIEILDENLLEQDNEAMALLIQKDGVSEELAPLMAAVENINHKLIQLSGRKDITLREKYKGLQILEVLEGKEAQEVYTG